MRVAREILRGAVTAAMLCLFACVHAPGARVGGPRPQWDTFSDTWAATDGLGRKLPDYAQVGPPRKDRFVGVFYFLWLGGFPGDGPYDVTQILKKDPTAMTHPDSPLWGPIGAPHYWGEPRFGYYRIDDEYVLRKHAQMLSDAGVDVIIFDVSNNVTYKPLYMKLLEVFSKIRSEGGKTPQIAFLCPFWEPSRVVHELYADLYGPGLYKDLWFQWKGKPLLLADPARVGHHNLASDRVSPWDLQPEKTLSESFVASLPLTSVGATFATYGKRGTGTTLSVFSGGPGGKLLSAKRFDDVPDNGWVRITFRRPLPPGKYTIEASDPKGHLGWWSDSGPLKFGAQVYVEDRPEAGTLALDLDWTTDSGVPFERFFTYRAPQPSYFEGPTKPNMWSWLEVYPQHVFRSGDGHKEQMSIGVAQNAVGDRLGSMSEAGARGRAWHDGANDESPGSIDQGLNFQEQAGRVLKEDPEFVFITGWNEWIAGRFSEFAGIKLPVMFVDEYDEEFSRDIEPMADGHGDDYYYQMAAFIRRYKGVRPAPLAGAPKTIDVQGPFGQWLDIRPEFRDDIDDPAHRDHAGWNAATRYVNATGRNDFATMKVSRDKDFVYFYAQTKDPISPFTDSHWMMLFLDIGDPALPNWSGYQFVVNRLPADASTCALEQCNGGWNWTLNSRIRYSVAGNEMQIAIPRSALGLSDTRKPLRLEFKWMDNMQTEGDITDFDLNGDAAPNGRFNYVYTTRSSAR